MALVLKDRVKETTTTTGTGTYTLAGAATGYQSFSVIGNGNTTYYTVADSTNWEVGIGTYTSAGTTLSRDTILASSNAGSAVSWGVGSKDVFVVYPAGRSVYVDGSSITPGTTATLPAISGGTGQTSYTDGQLLIGNSTGNTLTKSTLTAGSGITVTNGAGSITIAASPTLTFNNQTTAYTVVSGDNGKIINCTSGTFTVALTAAATLGSGFNCWIWNTSSTATDVITIDPSGAETIDGRSTLTLRRGEGMQVVCNGTNWDTGDKKVMRAYSENYAASDVRPAATANGAVAIGYNAQATNSHALAFGYGATASGNGSTALQSALASGAGSFAVGYYLGTGTVTASGTASIAMGQFNSASTASSNYSTAIGLSSAGYGSQAVTGAGAMALGGSYASGADSFAAALGNSSSSYGANATDTIAIGYLSKAGGNYSAAIGYGATINTATDSIAIGTAAKVSGASAARGLALGYLADAQTSGAVAISSASVGWETVAAGSGSIAIGERIKASVTGQYAFGVGAFSATGDAQSGMYILRRATTDATATVLTTDSNAGATTNQVILSNNSAYAFSGLIVARRQASGGTASAAWKVEGLIRREGTAASTTLVNSAITTIDNTPGWTVALSADTTNGGLAVTVTGAAATNIRWVGNFQTSEVTYA
jgi:Head domain of trimeric autotransporter adhesin